MALGLVISLFCLGFSGLVMSQYVFVAFSIDYSVAMARRIHLVAAYWGFVLMSIHLGMHGRWLIDPLRKRIRNKTIACQWLMRLGAWGIAGYGAVCFERENILAYMCGKAPFVFFDFTKSAAAMWMDYTAMMVWWMLVGFYLARGLGKLSV